MIIALLFLYGLPLVGIVQVVGLLIRLSFSKGRHPEYVRNLQNYRIAVLLYFLVLVISSGIPALQWDALGILYLFVLPSCMAIYYWTIIYHSYDVVTSDISLQENQTL